MNLSPLILFLLALAGCAVQRTEVGGQKLERQTPPRLISFQNRSGILPSAPTATLSLAWDAEGVLDDDWVVSYAVYWGPESRSYLWQQTVTTNVCTLTGLAVNARYYFTVTAIDVFGIESDFSDELGEFVGCFQTGGLPDPGWQVQVSADLFQWNACDGTRLLGTNQDQSLNWSVPLNDQPMQFYRLAGTNL